MITALRPRAEIELDRFALDPYCRLYLPLWKLDGDSFMSRDAYGHLCSRSSVPYWTPQGWKFDGNDDYVDCGSGTSLDLRNISFTLEAWAKRDSIGTYDFIINQAEAAAANKNLQFGFMDYNKFSFSFYDNDLISPLAYTDTDWHLWVGRYDASNRSRKIFRDSVEVASDTAGTHYQGFAALTIGQRITVAPPNNFDGLIALVLIYSRALTPQEILEHYIVGKSLFG